MSDGEGEGATQGEQSEFWLKTDLLGPARDILAHEQGKVPVDEAVFYLDASVLLRFYEVAGGLAGLERIYAALVQQGRLVVPGQAVREFYLKRTNKLLDISAMLKGFATFSLTNKMSKRSATLDDDPDFAEAARMYGEAGDAYRAAMKLVEQKLKPVIQRHDETPIGGDVLSRMYARVLPPAVLDPDWSDAERAAMPSEWGQRYAASHPPGFKDAGRNGDFLFWKTVLISAKAHGRPGIIVTGETKPDWFAQGASEGKVKRLRPELVAEYLAASGGSAVHAMSLREFLEALDAPAPAVEAAKAADEEAASEHSSLRLEEALLNERISQAFKVIQSNKDAILRTWAFEREDDQPPFGTSEHHAWQLRLAEMRLRNEQRRAFHEGVIEEAERQLGNLIEAKNAASARMRTLGGLGQAAG